MNRFEILILSSISGCSEPKKITEVYSGEWEEPSTDVILTLAKNQVRGCGEFYQKESKSTNQNT